MIKAQQVFKSYQSVEVLRGIDLEIQKGEALCIMGASGAGKSTLMHVLSSLDRPTKGEVLFNGKNIFQMNDEELSRFRNATMGFIFQSHHLLGEFSALENVMMPALIAGLSFKVAKEKAMALLSEMGLESRVKHRPNAMSGGEQQRVAIARALVRDPQVIFADEPTGNLDRKNGELVQKTLFEIQRKKQIALVVVTHDQDFARRFTRVRLLRDGQWC